MVADTIHDPSPSPGAEEDLLGCVADLHSQVPSRIPNANDNDSLSSEFLWVLIVSTVQVLPFELLNPREAFQWQVSTGVMAGANQDPIEDSTLLFPFALSQHLPLARRGEIRPLLHTAHSGLKLNILQKTKFFGVHPEVLQDLGVVHEVRKMIRDGVVTEAHHLLGGVDDHGFVDTGPSFVGTFLEPPQTSDVVGPFEADGLQALFQAALDASQPARSRPNHRHSFPGHGLPAASPVLRGSH